MSQSSIPASVRNLVSTDGMTRNIDPPLSILYEEATALRNELIVKAFDNDPFLTAGICLHVKIYIIVDQGAKADVARMIGALFEATKENVIVSWLDRQGHCDDILETNKIGSWDNEPLFKTFLISPWTIYVNIGDKTLTVCFILSRSLIPMQYSFLIKTAWSIVFA